MARARTDDLLVIAATAILILAAQRYFHPQPVGHPENLAGPDHQAIAGQPVARGGGRHARNPLQIPAGGWKDILWRTYARTNDDRLLATAAGVVFFGLLAVFPAITALVSCYGLFADTSTISANLQTLALMVPQDSFQIVQDQVARVLAKGSSELGWTLLFGAELNSEIERQTTVDTTVGRGKPLGRRGAVVADTLGAVSSRVAKQL